ncbi:hypothetical protein MRX96_016627 [Rhipicephalus microplus]
MVVAHAVAGGAAAVPTAADEGHRKGRDEEEEHRAPLPPEPVTGLWAPAQRRRPLPHAAPPGRVQRRQTHRQRRPWSFLFPSDPEEAPSRPARPSGTEGRRGGGSFTNTDDACASWVRGITRDHAGNISALVIRGKRQELWEGCVTSATTRGSSECSTVTLASFSEETRQLCKPAPSDSGLNCDVVPTRRRRRTGVIAHAIFRAGEFQ